MTGSVQTLVDVRGAGGSREARRTGAGEGVPGGVAGGTITTRLRGAVVDLFAVFPAVPRRTLAAVRIEGQQLACGAVHTGVVVAGVGDGYLTQRRLVADGTAAVEPRARHREDDITGAAILTAGSWAGATGIQVLAVFPNVSLGATEEERKKTCKF